MGKKRGGAPPRGERGAKAGPVDASRVRDMPFRRGGRFRVACEKQSNADMLQLDLGTPDVDAAAAAPAEEAEREARLKLARLTEKDNSAKAFMKELRKVLENADVILEVIDVRDPLGCRAYALEQEALRLGKRVVLILNKIDLVPAENTRAWLAYLRQEFPTLPFEASTQQQRHNLGQNQTMVWKKTTAGDESLAGGAEAVGTRAILQLIKNYSRNLNLKSSITVGTIGAPNVGKSSLINSLKRSRVCSVASTPGHTKVVQGIMLDRHVRLLDSPGIVFTDANAPPGATPDEIKAAAEAALLRNVLKVELVEDPIEPVQAILNRIDTKYLSDVYQVPLASRDVQDFLLRVAYKKGRMMRGAVPDLDGTARSVLHDWNTGRIKYHTEPPAKPVVRHAKPIAPAPKTEGSAAVLTAFSETFDLAGLLGAADAEVLGGDGHYEAPAPAPAPVPAPAPGAEPMVDMDATDSTLGKRGRNDADTSDASDDESDEDPWLHRRAPRGWTTLAVEEGESDDEPPAPAPAPAPARVPKSAKPVYTAAESEQMAPSRGKERRKARKEKKRRQHGMLAAEMETLMDLDAPDAGGAARPASEEKEAEEEEEEEEL